MNGRRVRNLRQWRARLAGGVLGVLSVQGPSTSAWAMDGGLLPRHPRVTDAQLVVPVPRATPETLARPAQAPVVASPRDTAAPTSAEPALPFDSLVRRAAQVASVDAALLHAIIDTESGYDPQAVSVRGAIGLMQVLPRTGERFGVRRLEDPAENVRAGASYVRWLLSRFDGDLTLALAAYNAGEGAVLRYGRQIPPFPETQNYVRKVMAGYARLRDESPAPVVPAAPARPMRPVEPTQGIRSLQSGQSTAPMQPMQSAQPVQTPRPRQPTAVLADMNTDTNTDTHPPATSTPALDLGDAASDGAATARAWRLLREVGALLTRSPSAEAAGGHGRDRPAVVMPARGQARSAGPAIGG